MKSLNRKVWVSLVMVFGILLSSFPLKSQISTQVSFGALYINGDVDRVLDAFNSFHLSLSKEVRKDLNIELKLGLAKAIGLSGSYMQTGANGGGLVEDVYSIVDNRVWYPNYWSSYNYVDLSTNYILNTGLERLRFVGGVGVGMSLSSVRVNLLGLEDSFYNVQYPIDTPISDVKSQLDFRYDSTYETDFEEAGGVIPHFNFQLGMQVKITRGIYFSADVRYHLTFSDYLDPISNVTSTEVSGDNDSVSIFTIGFVGYLLPDGKEDEGSRIIPIE